MISTKLPIYNLDYTPGFKRSYKRLIKNNPTLQIDIERALTALVNNPKDPALSSHKVNAIGLSKKVWSSNVTGDIRVIWDYGDKSELVILLLNLGGHSGSNKVYK